MLLGTALTVPYWGYGWAGATADLYLTVVRILLSMRTSLSSTNQFSYKTMPPSMTVEANSVLLGPVVVMTVLVVLTVATKVEVVLKVDMNLEVKNELLYKKEFNKI